MMHNDPSSGAAIAANDHASVQAALAAARAKREEEFRRAVAFDEESEANANAAKEHHYEELAEAKEEEPIAEGGIPPLKVANNKYNLTLVPLSFSIAENIALIPENTIVLKKDKKKGIIKAYLIKNGVVSKPITGLNLSAAEVEVMEFPDAGGAAVNIERAQFPELIDKVSLRCGLTTHRFGSASAFIFSVGCGITTVAALAPLMTIGPLFFVAAAVLGISTTVANWRMSRYDLPEIFMGGFDYLFKNKIKLKIDGIDHFVDEPISKLRAVSLAIGIACSIAFGTAIGILTFSATVALPVSFAFLSAISGVLPALGAAFMAVTLISLSVIMIKSMSDLAKSKTLSNSIENIFSNLFYIDPVKDAGFFGHTKRFATWLALAVVSFAALALTGLGAIFTMKSCVTGLNQALKFSNTAVEITLQVLGLAAQVPYTISTTLNPIFQLFYRWEKKPVVNDKQFAPIVDEEIDPDDLDLGNAKNVVVGALGAAASLVNAVGNGLIALNGKTFDITTEVGIGTVGAIANSFAATFGNTISTDIPAPRDPENLDFDDPKVVGSTRKILARNDFKHVNDDIHAEGYAATATGDGKKENAQEPAIEQQAKMDVAEAEIPRRNSFGIV